VRYLEEEIAKVEKRRRGGDIDITKNHVVEMEESE
jgi:hypothetical protein